VTEGNVLVGGNRGGQADQWPLRRMKE
jgi:hypothetical protein